MYDVNTSPEGLRAWWTSNCGVGFEVGAKSTFCFGETYNVMRIEKLVPGKEVRSKCIKQYHHAPGRLTKMDEWVGTFIVFRLTKNRQGGTDLIFEHEDLTASLECYEICEKGWDHFLKVSLKEYVEKGRGKTYIDG
ncbi:MAG: SRPBCC domain-containing protein [Candidatus Dadabacteria bacterium]|nr:SRPBCC domain-containing protein [Candidatus Dadabacteria bacterium]